MAFLLFPPLDYAINHGRHYIEMIFSTKYVPLKEVEKFIKENMGIGVEVNEMQRIVKDIEMGMSSEHK